MTNQIRTPAIVVTGLRKRFGSTTVLDGIDLSIPAGSIYALLGPNGAGKTTTVQILSTLIPATAGQVLVAGHDVATEPDAVRTVIGVTGQFSAVDNLLTGKENMLLMADLCHLSRREGRERAAQLLGQFELTEAAGKPAATYSGGMRRRLDIAMTLMIQPRILFLDEPTTGLDPRGRRRMWQIVRDLAGSGVTIFLTTQYLEEADDYVGVTIRAVRHYHQRGLLPEPERDASGYRRYGAEAVIELIRIRALADAGVPLARIEEVLAAGRAA